MEKVLDQEVKYQGGPELCGIGLGIQDSGMLRGKKCKERRKMSIIVHGIKEASSDHSEEREEEDLTMAASIPVETG
jgi:hypothetical protein